MNLFLPQDRHDLGIYQKMLMAGTIRAFAMPREVERLADHLLEMMEAARIAGRSRDALKCAEILRTLNKDNREMAAELDRIERLDAGKPTQISSQVAPETAERIKRIVATQRARALNTEADNVEGARGAVPPPARDGAGSRGQEGSGQVADGAGDDPGDRQAPPHERGFGAQDPASGGRT